MEQHFLTTKFCYENYISQYQRNKRIVIEIQIAIEIDVESENLQYLL